QDKSVPVLPGGARRSRQGHLADASGDAGDDGDGVRLRDPGDAVLLRRRPRPSGRRRLPARPRHVRESESAMAKRWYIVHAYSNFERKVADAIREKAEQSGLGDLFEEIMVPTEKVVEVRRGRKVDAERKFFPGYVLVRMDMTDEAYHLIRNTPKVTGFLGADNKPSPISEREALRIIQQVQEGIERPKPSVSFEV